MQRKTFILELGQEEGFDLERKYETEVTILPQRFDDSDSDDFDEITDEEGSVAPLEFLDELNNDDFDPPSHQTSVPHMTADLVFEKPVYNFWHEPGIVKLAIKCTDNTEWRTVDSDEDAIEGRDYVGGEGTLFSDDSEIEISILEDEGHKPVSFDVRMTSENTSIQTTIILRPIPFQN